MYIPQNIWIISEYNFMCYAKSLVMIIKKLNILIFKIIKSVDDFIPNLQVNIHIYSHLISYLQQLSYIIHAVIQIIYHILETYVPWAWKICAKCKVTVCVSITCLSHEVCTRFCFALFCCTFTAQWGREQPFRIKWINFSDNLIKR